MANETVKPVDAFRFSASVRLEDGGDAESKGKRFRLVANSGMPFEHWCGQLVFDLKGVKWGKDKLPVLHNHEPGRRVGWTDKIEVDEEKGLVMTGTFLKNAIAREVQEDAAAGYPWQASIYLKALKIEEIAEKTTAEVNGRTIIGPATIFRESYLREGSFCELGADEQTGAELFSAKKEDGMDPKKETAPDAAAAAVAAERARVAKIFAAADMPRQAALAAKFAADGTEVADALVALIEDQKKTIATMEAEIAKLRDDGDDEGDGDEGDGDGEETPRAKASDSDLAKEVLRLKAELRGGPTGQGKGKKPTGTFSSLKEEWDASPELQKEFFTFEGFEAFRQGQAA